MSLLRVMLCAMALNASIASAVECPSMDLQSSADCHPVAAAAEHSAHAEHAELSNKGDHAGHGEHTDHAEQQTNSPDCTCCQLCVTDKLTPLSSAAITVTATAVLAADFAGDMYGAVIFQSPFNTALIRGPPAALSS